ncbi:MAG: hypothetical protein M3275_07200 [Thermoproteota archaeon]|nr:hypothetical protein [Thermoproteota archaeon]
MLITKQIKSIFGSLKESLSGSGTSQIMLKNGIEPMAGVATITLLGFPGKTVSR